MNTYYVLARTGEQHEFNIEQLVDMFTDWASWLSFLGLATGKKTATMTAVMQDGARHTYSVAKTPFEKF